MEPSLKFRPGKQAVCQAPRRNSSTYTFNVCVCEWHEKVSFTVIKTNTRVGRCVSPMCSSVLQCAAECSRVLQSAAECCSVLQCAAVCYSVLQCAAGVCVLASRLQTI